MHRDRDLLIRWGIYALVVVLVLGGLSYLGLPTLVLSSDHSHLTAVILVLYVYAEIVAARQAWKLSKEQDAARDILIEAPFVSPETLCAKFVDGSCDDADLDLLHADLTRGADHVEFIASRIVWIGILATILGVILAFWPLLGATITIEAMRASLGGFFAGIAVAFVPTAVSFVCKIALDFNANMLCTASERIALVMSVVASRIRFIRS